MTDRELLELAAKAAGVDVPKKLSPWDQYSDSRGFEKLNMDGSAVQWRWNPRNDRADALNLSARLHINIEHGKHSVRAWTGDDAPVMVDETVFVADESKRSDAMCLAVTRAAAEIGRGM